MTLDEHKIGSLLKATTMQPPDDFTERVMRRIQSEGAATSDSLKHFQPSDSRSAQSLRFMRWALVAIGGIVGVAQSGLFVFGLWFATAAG